MGTQVTLEHPVLKTASINQERNICGALEKQTSVGFHPTTATHTLHSAKQDSQCGAPPTRPRVVYACGWTIDFAADAATTAAATDLLHPVQINHEEKSLRAIIVCGAARFLC